MPRVVFVPLVGFRVREAEMLELGMSLPGLRDRAQAIGELPALGALTLAGMLTEEWTCSYLPWSSVEPAHVDRILAERPDLVAISALTASIVDAYRLSERVIHDAAAEMRDIIDSLSDSSDVEDQAFARKLRRILESVPGETKGDQSVELDE